MRVCYFGDYNPEYARNRVIAKGVGNYGISVIKCHSQDRGWVKYWRLFKAHRSLSYDILLVGYSRDRWIVFLAWLIKKKPLYWDAFYSIYDSWVFDRKLTSKFHPKAWYYFLLDWLACHLADKILLDTNAHIDYFAKTFRVKREKFVRVLVGSDDDVFYPRPEKKTSQKSKFIIHFHGKFIPLQGVEYIIQAVKLLENEKNIVWQIIGKGQEYKKIRRLTSQLRLDNINFIDPVPYWELPQYINKADVCLGIFGSSGKTQRVIPNKVYEAVAMGKAVITANTPAVREVFTDGENIVLCKAASPDSLAEAILFLKDNADKRAAIGRAAASLFQSKLTPTKVTEPLIESFKQTNES